MGFLDGHSGRRPGPQFVFAFIVRIDLDPHRHPLCQFDPGVAGVDVGQQSTAGEVFPVGDGEGDALHGAAKPFTAHQLDVHPVALAYSRQLGFFEVATDIEAFG